MATTKVQSELIVDDVALAGNPTTTTQGAGNNTTRIATTAFVTTAINNLINSAPGTLDTLDEIAAALNDDPSFTTTVNNAIATKLPLSGGTMTGALNMGTQNITNAGTIASGAITSTGIVTATNFEFSGTAGKIHFGGSADTGDYLGLADVSSGSNIFELYQDSGLKFGIDGVTGDATFNASNFIVQSANSTDPQFRIKNTNADAQAPQLILQKDSSSPADGDEVGRIYFLGDDDAGNVTEAFLAIGKMTDVSNGSEDSSFDLYTYQAGSQKATLTLKSGLVGINQTSPAAKLDIKGDTTTYDGMSKIYLTDTSSNSERRNWAIGNGGSGFGHFSIGLSNAADGDPMASGTHTTPFVIDHTGNVAIGRNQNVGKGLLTISEVGNTAGEAIDGLQLYKGLTNASNFLAWQQGNMGWRLGIRHNDGGYPLTLYMANGTTPTASSPGDEILRFGTDQNMALNNTTTGWSAWGSNTSTHLTVGNGGNSPTSSNYGVLNLLGSQAGSTHFSIGVGNGTMYAAYDYGNGAHRLTIDSSGNFTGSSSNDISDQRLKENIVTIPNALDKVKALKGRTFTWKAESKQPSGTKYGFIAQEVEPVASDLVYNDSGLCKIDSDDNPIHDIINYEGDAEYAKSVQTSGIIPILVEAMKEQQTIIDDLKSRIEALEG
jgi:hypothetical protein|tara:strand:+ start:1003 stop:2991 length:1989 start_codon:yes stop_codon:yes gene_type:complete